MCVIDLMQRYCDGDSAAFRAFYDQTAPTLHGYLLGLTHERAAADDLLQEAFLKLHNARGSYVRGADPLPWLYTIAHRSFLDYTRRHKRARVRATDDGEVPEIATQLDGRREAESADAPEGDPLTSALREAIARLPPQQRQALELTRLARRPIADAARELGISAGAVKLRAHRAVQKLRAQLAGSEDLAAERS